MPGSIIELVICEVFWVKTVLKAGRGGTVPFTRSRMPVADGIVEHRQIR